MSIQPYILTTSKIFPVSSKVKELQKVFAENSFSHLAVEKEGVYLGSFSEEDILSFDPDKPVEDFMYAAEGFFARNEDNWLEVLDIFSKNQTNILPVLDEQNSFLGNVALEDFINIFIQAPFLNLSGGIMVVEKGYKDYSFSEISQIIESNGTHLLGAFISKLENDVAQITIKIGQTGLNTILQAFRRYGYNVISIHQEDTFQANLRDRSKYLEKYLNV